MGTWPYGGNKQLCAWKAAVHRRRRQGCSKATTAVGDHNNSGRQQMREQVADDSSILDLRLAVDLPLDMTKGRVCF